MSKALPRPWVRGKGFGQGYIVAVGDGTQPAKHVAELYYAGLTTEERNANGDLIVTAVNAHDDLVEAMEKARGLLARGRTVGRERQIGKLALEAENILIEALDALKEITP